MADGYVNSRVAEYRQEWPFTPGSAESGPGEMSLLHAIVVDAKGDVYVGSRSDRRIVVFDNDLNYKTVYDHVGAPWAGVSLRPPSIPLHRQLQPRQPEHPATRGHEAFKMELDGQCGRRRFGVPAKSRDSSARWADWIAPSPMKF